MLCSTGRIEDQGAVFLPRTCDTTMPHGPGGRASALLGLTGSGALFLQGIPPPAECRVQGFVIESLEPQLNYRRPYTLRISADPEEKMHLLPYLRAFQDTTMATRWVRPWSLACSLGARMSQALVFGKRGVRQGMPEAVARAVWVTEGSSE